MEFRLLIDFDALMVLDGLPAGVRNGILVHLLRLRRSPAQYSIDQTTDVTGRTIDISAVGGHAIQYWIDSADRHVKVMKISGVRR